MYTMVYRATKMSPRIRCSLAVLFALVLLASSAQGNFVLIGSASVAVIGLSKLTVAVLLSIF